MRKLLLTALVWLATATAVAAQIVTGSVPNTFVNGTVIDATQVNADYTYIINQINANGAKNGSNSDITALTALVTPLTPAQSGSNIYIANATSTGTANAQVVAAATPINFTLSYGKTIRFVAGFTNTGATTLAVNGLAATNVYRQTPLGLAALTGGEIVAGNTVEAFFDGVQFELFNPGNQTGGFGPLTALGASATPDIGTVPSHNVNLSGGPFTITSFGSSASTTYPMYLIRFNAANTLVNSANLNILNGSSRLTASADQGLYFYSGAGVWYELAYFPAAVRVGVTGANALYIHNNAVTPATQIDIVASEVVMDNGAGGSYYVENYGTCTINLAVNGANGLDTGAVAANTWYYLYAIGQGTTTNVCLASTSATAPTMPGVYTYKARLGAIRTLSGAATLWSFQQRGNETWVTSTDGSDHVIGSGAAGNCAVPSTVATSTVWGVAIPATASRAIATASALNSNTCVSGNTSNTQSRTCAFSSSASLEGTVQARINYMGTTNLYWCGQVGSVLLVAGWDDAVNAN